MPESLTQNELKKVKEAIYIMGEINELVKLQNGQEDDTIGLFFATTILQDILEAIPEANNYYKEFIIAIKEELEKNAKNR